MGSTQVNFTLDWSENVETFETVVFEENSNFKVFMEDEKVVIHESDHNVLINRNLDNQHPINAITGLQTALDSKQGLLVTGPDSGIIIEDNYIRIDNHFIDLIDCGTSTTVN